MSYVDFQANNGIFRVVYTETTSVNSNSSTITVTGCQFASTGYHNSFFYSDGVVQINGTTVVTLVNGSDNSIYVTDLNTFYNIPGSSGQSVTVAHNTDGSGSMSVTIKGRPGVYNDMNMFCYSDYRGNYEYNGSLAVALTKIDRYFNLYLYAGSNTGITVNRTASPLGGSIGVIGHGATIYYGDTLNIEYTIGAGCTILVHTINGSTFTSGTNYTVTSAVTVRTTASVNSFILSINAGPNSSVIVNRTSSPKQGAAQGYLSDGVTVYYGDVLSVSFNTSTGYNINAHTLNGNEFVSGISHTVTEDVSVVTTAVVKVFTLTKTIGIGTVLTVRRTASPNGGGSIGILTGNTVYYGDVLELTASSNPGYSIELMSVNGTPYTDNPHTHTVIDSVIVVIGSKALGFVYIDSGASIEKYKIVIDSGSAMEQYRAMIDTGSEIVPY